jgi:hypothetical protein
VTDRVHWENEEEISNALGDTLAEMAWPGVFTSGKRIVATQTSKRADFDVMNFKFADGSEMNIVGKFEVRYKQPPPFVKSDTTNVVGTQGPTELIQHGDELMSGQLSLEEGDAEE